MKASNFRIPVLYAIITPYAISSRALVCFRLVSIFSPPGSRHLGTWRQYHLYLLLSWGPRALYLFLGHARPMLGQRLPPREGESLPPPH